MSDSNMVDFFPEEILSKFDTFLQERNLSYENGIAVGGAAVAILYRKTRMTQDIDLLTAIPHEVKSASVEFAKRHGLSDNWLNNRVVNLSNCKPHGWGKDLLLLYKGPALSLYSISRENLLATKVFAFCDRSEGIAIDLPDLKSMLPTGEEIDKACLWTLAEAQRQKRSKKEIENFRAATELLKRNLTSAQGA